MYGLGDNLYQSSAKQYLTMRRFWREFSVCSDPLYIPCIADQKSAIPGQLGELPASLIYIETI